MRLTFASLALAASVALNLAAWPATPAQAQVRLPALGEAEADQFSIADEKKLGEQIMRQIRPDPDVVDDPVLVDYLQSVFLPLLEKARQRGDISNDMNQAFGWETFLVRDRTFNAFALPGGYIGVHLGLIAASGSRDELASVLAHELSHVTQRHIARSMIANKHQSIVALGGMLLGLLAASKSGNPDIPMAIIATGQASLATGQLTFSRSMETEADRFGLDLMSDAGFAPSGMAAMFERLDAASQLNDNNQYPWLRSHPLTIERLAEARLRARIVPAPDPRQSHLTEHALMRARARALMDTSDPALRRMQAQGRLTVPMIDSERLGALYGGALASIELRDFKTAESMMATAQQVMEQHAVAAAQQARLDAAGKAAPPPAPPASEPGVVTSTVVITAAAPAYPIEPAVARDFALLRVENAVAKRAPAEIVAAVEALPNDRSRPVVLERAQAAIGRSVAGDPAAAAGLRRETEALQTWVTDHPKDALAWTLLSQTAEPLGMKLRAIRAEAESHAAQGDLLGAIDRFRAGQRAARDGGTDFVEASIIDTRLREIQTERRELGRDLHDADHP